MDWEWTGTGLGILLPIHTVKLHFFSARNIGNIPRNVLGVLGFLGGSARNQWLRVKPSEVEE